MEQQLTTSDPNGLAISQKFVRAFGLVFVQNTYPKDLRYKLIPKDVVTCTIFCSSGNADTVDSETGMPTEGIQPGVMWGGSSNWVKEYDVHITEPTVVYCYDELVNSGQKPNLSPVDLPQGESTTFPNGTKFLLCDGVLNINNTSFTGPVAIAITTGDKVVAPQTRCLGIKIA